MNNEMPRKRIKFLNSVHSLIREYSQQNEDYFERKDRRAIAELNNTLESVDFQLDPRQYFSSILSRKHKIKGD